MPKEIAHIHLAKDVFFHLPESSLFSKAIRTHFNLFLYGAIAPDTFYYYLFGPNPSFVLNLSHRIHAQNGSSLLPFLNFLNHFKKEEPGALAFLAGICCHIMTDTIFHPMVYYFCGMAGVHSNAEIRHITFETALDVYFWQIGKEKKMPDFDQILYPHTIKKKRLIDYLEILFNLKHGSRKFHLSHALKCHKFACRCFQSISMYKVIKSLHQHGIKSLSKYEALFYPISKPVPLTFFDNIMHYKNPISGSNKTDTINDLSLRMRHQTLCILNLIENALLKNMDITSCLDHPDWPDIKPSFSKQEVLFWYEQKNIRKMIYKDAHNEPGKSKPKRKINESKDWY